MQLFRKSKSKIPPPPPPLPKVLVLRFSSIGDIVLSTPVLRCLKQQRPEVILHYLTKKSMLPVLEANPYIDQLIGIEENVLEVIPRLQKEGYTHIIDLHNNLRTNKVKRSLSGTTAFTLNKLNIRKWLYVNFKVDLMPKISIVERYLATVKKLHIQNDGQGLDYFIPDKDRVTNDDLPVSHWAGYVACVIGGTYVTKRLPAEQWRDYCARSPFPIVLLGGPEERALGEEIAQEDPIKIYNSCGKFNINESADLIARAQVVVSNDTGLMHIAAALKKPLISIWGNTTPEMGMFPYYGYNDWRHRKAPQSEASQVQSLRCRPCSKLGYQRCPRGHFKCMRQQNIGQMMDWTKKYWETQR